MAMRYTGFGMLLLWLALSSFGPGDGFREQFRAAFRAGEPQAVKKVLAEWEKAAPRDPDLYVAQFNWLLKKGERLEMQSSAPAAGDALLIKDKSGKAVGNIGSGYDPVLVEQAGQALAKGLTFALDRLDMHFGLAKMYEMSKQPEREVQVLRAALAKHPAGAWRWRDGNPLPAPEAEFVPNSLEEYATFYWRQEQADALEPGRAIADLIVQYYPKSALGPFNVGVYYLIKKEPAHAYASMQQADALAPTDLSTLGNLTRLAIDLKRKDEATAYLARLRKLPGSKERADAYAKDLQKL